MKQDVNYIKHQKAVYIKMVEDQNLTATHISLYNALFMIWNECAFDTELSINRNDIMKLSKIGSANTYTKCLKKLSELNYIFYKPSYNPLVGSKINLYRFDNGSDKGSVKGTSKGSDNGCDNGCDTLYKLLNNKTIKLLKQNKDLVNDKLEIWINSEKKVIDGLVYPFESENFLKFWKAWKEYKKTEHKFNYKSVLSEQAALKKLCELSSGKEDIALKIIENSISNGWQGFFAVEKKQNGSSGKMTTEERQAANRRIFQKVMEGTK